MEETIFFDNAKESVTKFFEQEFENFPPLLMSHFLNRFNDLLDYAEEDLKIKPKIIFTDNIESLVKFVPKTMALTIFEDSEATMFNNRLKSILALSRQDWCLFIDLKEDKISYGLMMSFRSIKDKNFLQVLEDTTFSKERTSKTHCIIARPLNSYSMLLHSISGETLNVNFSLDKSKNNVFTKEIQELVDATFSKLRTTQRKLADMKNMYLNIFTNVLNDVHGALCVIVDKDYVDNGLFEDGIWLKEPINFSKLFTQSKSYSEEKLQAHADLFLNMLNFDGITIIDNMGRLRAYNVFVEPNSKKVGYIVGGARKRAAFHILSSKRKGIVGVYFQSHEGEVFFQALKQNTPKQKKQEAKLEVKPEPTVEVKPDEIKPQVNEENTNTDNNPVVLISEKIESNTAETQAEYKESAQ